MLSLEKKRSLPQSSKCCLFCNTVFIVSWYFVNATYLSLPESCYKLWITREWDFNVIQEWKVPLRNKEQNIQSFHGRTEYSFQSHISKTHIQWKHFPFLEHKGRGNLRILKWSLFITTSDFFLSRDHWLQTMRRRRIDIIPFPLKATMHSLCFFPLVFFFLFHNNICMPKKWFSFFGALKLSQWVQSWGHCSYRLCLLCFEQATEKPATFTTEAKFV